MLNTGRSFVGIIPKVPTHVRDEFDKKLKSADFEILAAAEALGANKTGSTGNVDLFLKLCKTWHEQYESDIPDKRKIPQLKDLFDAWVGQCTNSTADCSIVMNRLQERGAEVGQLSVGDSEIKEIKDLRKELMEYFQLFGQDQAKRDIIHRKECEPRAEQKIVFEDYRRLFVQIIIDAIAASVDQVEPESESEHFIQGDHKAELCDE